MFFAAPAPLKNYLASPKSCGWLYVPVRQLVIESPVVILDGGYVK